jgi:hypothetical protein
VTDPYREGVTTDILADLDDDAAQGICATIKSPTGLIDNSAAVGANGDAAPNVPAQIRNPQVPVT